MVTNVRKFEINNVTEFVVLMTLDFNIYYYHLWNPCDFADLHLAISQSIDQSVSQSVTTLLSPVDNYLCSSIVANDTEKTRHMST